MMQSEVVKRFLHCAALTGAQAHIGLAVVPGKTPRRIFGWSWACVHSGQSEIWVEICHDCHPSEDGWLSACWMTG